MHVSTSTHRRECECEACLAEYGDWFAFLRLIEQDTEPDDREDFDAWAEADDALLAEIGEGVAS
jgi:hypothetical protein